MSRFDLNNNHPITPNSNQYFYEQKFISIHSEDRDITKYNNAALFEIELPQDYLNVVSATLYSWSFPSNYSVFSIDANNVYITFKFTDLYNPADHSYTDPLTIAIYAGLLYRPDDYLILIEPGFYSPSQLVTELTNKFNEIVTKYLTSFFVDPNYPEYNYAASLFTGYDRFQIVYNTVELNIWFGNNADQFVLTTVSNPIYAKNKSQTKCNQINRLQLPNYTDYGLPSFLGLTNEDQSSLSVAEAYKIHPNSTNISIVDMLPRFYYGDAVPNSGDNGYWLKPVLPGALVYFLYAAFKINTLGPSYIYMEIEGLNCIDETIPYNLSTFTSHTNQTNGVVNSSFAKIPVASTPISQWYDNTSSPYKYFNPPAERIRKLKIKFRYHNNTLVDFGLFDYSVMLQFNLLRPQQERQSSIRDAFNTMQYQKN
jgi:hypothetical protein